MSDGSQPEVSEDSNIKQTALGGMEFSGSVEPKDPLAAKTVPAPEGIPEKFWDPIEGKLRTEDLVKSYQALEAKLGQPKADADPDPNADPNADPDANPNADPDAAPDADPDADPDAGPDADPKDPEADPEVVDSTEFKVAMEAAQEVYAKTGELPEEQRKPFLDLGFTNQQIDLYLNGVKATEAALYSAAHKAAGSPEAYSAAIKWAAEGGLTPKQIAAFNSQVGDVETVGPAVAGLMASFKAANPGEGQLTNVNSGVNHGDVYESMAEFQQDLRAADKVRDQVARKKAVDKLRRSRAAGTIKHSNRRQPFGGGSK